MMRTRGFYGLVGSVSGAILVLLVACSDDTKVTPTPTPLSTDSGASDVLQKKDAPKPPEEDAASTCVPGDLEGFEPPTWVPPAPFGQGPCTPTQIDGLIECNFEPQDEDACNEMLANSANDACQACMFTETDASAFGPIIIDSAQGYAYLNLGGCLANVEGNTTAASCGAKFDAANSCADYACASNCPGTDEAAANAYYACVDAALAGVCETYGEPAKCADALTAPGTAGEACAFADDFLASAAAISKLFCVGSGTDGGTDADAATDALLDAPADG